MNEWTTVGTDNRGWRAVGSRSDKKGFCHASRKGFVTRLTSGWHVEDDSLCFSYFDVVYLCIPSCIRCFAFGVFFSLFFFCLNHVSCIYYCYYFLECRVGTFIYCLPNSCTSCWAVLLILCMFVWFLCLYKEHLVRESIFRQTFFVRLRIGRSRGQKWMRLWSQFTVE